MLPEAATKLEKPEAKPRSKRKAVRKTVAPVLISIVGVADKFSIHQRSVARWVEKGILPAPIKIRGRSYWRADVEPKSDDAAIADGKPKTDAPIAGVEPKTDAA